MIEIEVEYFKTNGGWYMSQQLSVPNNLIAYEARIWIKENRPYKDEFIMVITEEKAMDYIGFPMMELPKEE